MDHLKMQGQLRIILALGEQSRLGVNMTENESLVTEGEAASLLRSPKPGSGAPDREGEVKANITRRNPHLLARGYP